MIESLINSMSTVYHHLSNNIIWILAPDYNLSKIQSPEKDMT